MLCGWLALKIVRLYLSRKTTTCRNTTVAWKRHVVVFFSRSLELLSNYNELITRGKDLVTRGSEILVRGNVLLSSYLEGTS